MRIIVLILLIFPFFSISQDEKVRKFLGFGLEGDFNLLDEPTLSFDEYQAIIGEQNFFIHNSSAELISTDQLFTRNGVRARLIFKGPDNKNLGAFKQSRFVVGALYNQGNNYTFEFSRDEFVRGDTVTMIHSGGYTEVLYKDTIYHHSTMYTANSRNLGLFCEYLIYTGEGMPALATGIGIASDMTLLYEAKAVQNTDYTTGLFNDSGIAQYAPVEYNAGNDTYTYSHYTYVSEQNQSRKIKTAYFIRPYIPVRLETPLSNRPKLMNFTVDINGKIGTEIQINPGASVNARMFYSLGIGLNYYL